MTEQADEGAGAQQPVGPTGHGTVDPFAPPLSAPPDTPWGFASPTSGPPPSPAAWPQPSWPPNSAPDGWGTGGYPEPRSTNPWAIVALVTGILGVVPVAVGAGIAALVQIRRRGQAGTGLAIGGIVAAAVWIVGGLLVVAVGLFVANGSDGALGRIADVGSTSISSCLREPTGDGSLSTQVDCADGHDAEVYLADDLAGDHWPGYDTIDGRADDACFDAFESYVGASYDSSDYDYGYFLPDQAEWTAGEHRVVCVVLAGHEDTLHGSVRGSRR